MDMLAVREREKYSAVWGDPQYRVVSPGARHFAFALDWLDPEPGASFTDWGSGAGQAATALDERGFDVRLVDIASNAYRGDLPYVEACLWSLPDDLEPTDYGFCADVMEHIPTEHVDAVFAGIAARTRRKCYFQIALFEDHHFTANGPLHLSVFPVEWWQDKIAPHFGTVEMRMVRRKHVLLVAEKS
jgi:hypothetical protein